MTDWESGEKIICRTFSMTRLRPRVMTSWTWLKPVPWFSTRPRPVTEGRSAMRYTPAPMPNMISPTGTRLSSGLRPTLASTTAPYMPRVTKSPWAKFTTRVLPSTSVRPLLNIPYRPPTIIPLTSASRKVCVADPSLGLP